VIVAVTGMRVVEVTIHQIVDMVAVGHDLMATVTAMHMAGLMPGAAVVWRALVRVGRRNLDHMFIHVVTMRVVEMAVVQMVHMAGMTHGDMAAARAVLMRMIGVVGLGASGHVVPFARYLEPLPSLRRGTDESNSRANLTPATTPGQGGDAGGDGA
jgi:hypothetical protein